MVISIVIIDTVNLTFHIRTPLDFLFYVSSMKRFNIQESDLFTFSLPISLRYNPINILSSDSLSGNIFRKQKGGKPWNFRSVCV